MSDQIDHPAHYGGDTPYEVIKVLEAWGLDNSFCLGNAVKYIACAGKKNDALTDLRKARWYLDRLISKLENMTQKEIREAGFDSPETMIGGESS